MGFMDQYTRQASEVTPVEVTLASGLAPQPEPVTLPVALSVVTPRKGRGRGTIPEDVTQIVQVLRAIGRKAKSSDYRNKLSELTGEPKKANATQVLIRAATKYPELIGWDQGNPNLFWVID